jgi:hypothetical protein
MMKHLICNALQPWAVKDGELTAPVLLAVPGIHHGSLGPLLWPVGVLKRHAKDFDGIPVTMRHPENSEGHFVSIDYDTQIKQQYSRGVLVNTKFDQRKKGIVGTIEIPINTPDLSLCQQAKNVSIGVFTEDIGVSGWLDGAYFDGIVAEVLHADHLALLPDQLPACAGTGIGNNQKEGVTMEALYPLGVRTAEDEKAPCQAAIREMADRHNLLLPIGMGGRDQEPERPSNDNPDVLLPLGMNR